MTKLSYIICVTLRHRIGDSQYGWFTRLMNHLMDESSGAARIPRPRFDPYARINNTLAMYTCCIPLICTLYSVQCSMYSVQCTLYSVQYTMYNVQCTLSWTSLQQITLKCLNCIGVDTWYTNTRFHIHCTLYSVQCQM